MEQQHPTTYTCAECGLLVVMTTDGPRRTCEHQEAGIIAHCSAVLTGKATVS